MKFFLVDKEGRTNTLELPEDFRMDELYCQLNNIADDVPDATVHQRMANSDAALKTKSGAFIRFADYANGTTKLTDLGINSNAEYHYIGDFAKEGENGAA
jgi:hypothetical protein